jgi:hypothetical protein
VIATEAGYEDARAQIVAGAGACYSVEGCTPMIWWPDGGHVVGG